MGATTDDIAVHIAMHGCMKHLQTTWRSCPSAAPSMSGFSTDADPMGSSSMPLRSSSPPGSKARFWDREANKYAASPISDVGGYEATLARVKGLLSDTDDVLEVGCGTGTTALRLAAGTRRLLATDLSPAMIQIARQKLGAQPCDRLRFEVADAEFPVAPPASHDVVLAFSVLHLLSNLGPALHALLAPLKPGGLLITKTPCLREMNPLVPRLAVPLMRALGKAPPVLIFDAAQLQDAMESHGLKIEAMERHGTTRKDVRAFIVARKVH